MNASSVSICTLAVVCLAPISSYAGEETQVLGYEGQLMAESALYESFDGFPERYSASMQIQFRYNYNQRGSDSTTLANPGDDLTLGFTNRRTKLGLKANVTESITARAKFGLSQSSGTAILENTEMTWKLSDTVIFQAGQFKESLIREENISSSKQLAVERSILNETFNQDYFQGVKLTVKEEDWRLMASFGDGFASDNTYFNSSAEADSSLTIRGELRFGEASWSQYKQFTSWRGANGGLMVGAAFNHQAMGNTNPATSPSTSLETGTIDASLLGDGWNLYAAGIWRTMDSGVSSLTDTGFLLQGGVFVSDIDEFYARWDVVMPSDSTPIIVGVSGKSDFNTFTVGWNHYVSPESHAAKFTLEFQHYPDPTTESNITVKGNILPDSTGDQFAITAQFQLLF